MGNPTAIRSLGVCATLVMLACVLSAQAPANSANPTNPTNPRFARWKLKSTAAAPSSNIMTYEPFNGTGMKVTIESVNASGTKSQWGYTTMFDGKDEPVTGRNGTATGSVRVITEQINEIIYKDADGKIVQVLMNVLSPDGKTITVSYTSANAQGLQKPTYATYEKMQ
jgi:hypothetical protein